MAADLKRSSKTSRTLILEKEQILLNLSQNCNLTIPEIQKIFWYGIVACLAVVSYSNSLECDLLHDDVFAVKENEDVLAKSSLFQLFKNDFWGKPMASNTSHKSYRPLCVLTFRLNFLISGLNAFGFHLANFVLHVVVCCVFVYFVDFVVFKSTQLAAISGMLFATHPIHTEAVTGVVGRADVLACLFFLLSFLSFIRSTSDTMSNQWFNLVLCLVFGCMAMLAKEQGVTVFGVCMIYDIMVINKLWTRLWKNGWSYLFPLPSMLLHRLEALTVTTIVLLLFRIWMLGGNLPQFIKQDNPASFSESLATRVMTYCYLYAFNAWLLLTPSNLCYDWQGGSIPLVESVLDPRNLATIGFFIVIGWLVYYCLCFSEEKDQPVVLMGLVLSVIPFLPASNILFRVGFVVAERILYIPSMGFCILITHGANKLAFQGTAIPTSPTVKHQNGLSKPRQENNHSQRATLITTFLFLLIGGFCIKTIKRNEVWRTRETLFKSGVEMLPHNAKMHYNYGNYLKDIGKHEEAIKHYRISIQLEPDHVSSHNNLGTLLNNDIQEAIKHFEIAIKYDPMHASSYFNLGVRLGMLKDYWRAEKILREAMRLKPGYTDAMLNLAGLLAEQTKMAEAETVYRDVVRVSPDNADGYNNYGVFLVKQGKPNEAMNMYKKAIKLQPNHSVAHVNMGRLLKNRGELEKAEKALKKALSIKREESTLQLLGVLYYNQNRLAEAEQAWKQVLDMNPTSEECLSNMGILMSRLGRHGDAVHLATKVLHLNSNKPDHYKNLASALERSNQITEAIKILSAALEKFQTAELYYHHGNLLKDINRYDEAKLSFVNAVKLDARHASAHMNLGVILHMQKDYTEARKHYEIALALDPDNKVLQQNLAKLKRLQARAGR